MLLFRARCTFLARDARPYSEQDLPSLHGMHALIGRPSPSIPHCGTGKAQLKAFGRRSQHGPGKGGPVLRVPLGKVKGDIFVTVSYIVHLETAGNIMSLTHVSTWKPPRTGWHVARDAAVAAAAAGQAAGAAAAAALGAHTQKDAGGSPGGAHKGHAAHVAAGAAPAAAPAGGSGGRRGHRGKASDLYDLTFELEVISHRGLNQVSGPKHVTVRPKYDALLVQGYSQVCSMPGVGHLRRGGMGGKHVV